MSVGESDRDGVSVASFTVGWIAALPRELTAALEMLDDEFERAPQDFEKHLRDTNSYSWGKIGDHYMVIASLPAGIDGTTAASVTASNMVSSLPQIRFGLLVGIGAGVPWTIASDGEPVLSRDIQLGDVVVSKPEGISGGVVCYDHGKALDGRYELKGTLSAPPTALLTALARLQAQHTRGRRKLDQALEKMLENDDLEDFKYPGASHDVLLAHTEHDKGSEGPKKKPRRFPTIHYGAIASGNSVIKSAHERTRILRTLNEQNLKPMCFEMEAAGLMNSFPCLVIRGICDYADEHKDDTWQDHAAATAAAFAKDFLGYVDATEVKNTQAITDRLSGIASEVEATKDIVIDHRLVDWLSAPDPRVNYEKAVRLRHAGTGEWLLRKEEFVRWQNSDRSALWLHGMSGCGKTVLSSTIVQHLVSARSDDALVLYFFFDFSEKKKTAPDGMIRSHIQQCLAQDPSGAARQYCITRRNETPSLKHLMSTLDIMLKHFSRVQIVLDALDECERDNRADLLWSVKQLAEREDNINLLMVSRPEWDIESSLKEWKDKPTMIEIDNTAVDFDIASFVEAHLQDPKGTLSLWKDRPIEQELIQSTLVQGAKGMFRWVECQFKAVAECVDVVSLREVLQTLPSTLFETFSALPDQKTRIRILQFLTYFEQQWTIDALVDATATSGEPDQPFDPGHRMLDPHHVVKVCSSLISANMESLGWPPSRKLCVRLAHSSVQEYLQSGKAKAEYRQHFVGHYALSVMTRVSINYLSGVAASSPFVEMLRIVEETIEWRNLDRESYDLFPLRETAFAIVINHTKERWASNDTIDSDISRLVFSRNGVLFQPGNQISGLQNYFQKHGFWPVMYFAAQSGSIPWLNYSLRSPHARGELHAHASADEVPHGQSVWDAVNGYSPMVAACSQSDINVLQTLLAAMHPDASQKSDIIRRALCKAASAANLQMWELLFAYDQVDINSHDARYGSILSAANISKRPNMDIISRLLSQGVGVNGNCNCHWNPLTTASSFGKADIVRLLLAHGADVNLCSKGVLPLAAAARHGTLEIVRLLLAADADVNQSTKEGWTALNAACEREYDEGLAIISTLLEAGADFHEPPPDSKRNDVLFTVCDHGNADALELLIHHGMDASPDRLEKAFAHALDFEEPDVRVLKLLGSLATFWAGSLDGNILLLACRRDCEKGVRFILTEGVQGGDNGKNALLRQAEVVLHTQLDGNTVAEFSSKDASQSANGLLFSVLEAALAFSASLGHERIVRLLLANHVDVNACGGIALWCASAAGHPNTVELLLERGASIESQCSVRRLTALGVASFLGHAETVGCLLDSGAAAYNPEGFVPPSVAALWGSNADVARVLQDRGLGHARDYLGWPTQGCVLEEATARIASLRSIYKDRQWYTEELRDMEDLFSALRKASEGSERSFQRLFDILHESNETTGSQNRRRYSEVLAGKPSVWGEIPSRRRASWHYTRMQDDHVEEVWIEDARWKWHRLSEDIDRLFESEQKEESETSYLSSTSSW